MSAQGLRFRPPSLSSLGRWSMAHCQPPSAPSLLLSHFSVPICCCLVGCCCPLIGTLSVQHWCVLVATVVHAVVRSTCGGAAGHTACCSGCLPTPREALVAAPKVPTQCVDPPGFGGVCGTCACMAAAGSVRASDSLLLTVQGCHVAGGRSPTWWAPRPAMASRGPRWAGAWRCSRMWYAMSSNGTPFTKVAVPDTAQTLTQLSCNSEALPYVSFSLSLPTK